MQTELSVIIPCFNSGKTISGLVGCISDLLNQNRIVHEFILVNDVSKDNTWQIIKHLATLFDNVIGVNLLQNSGQEFATLYGLKYANGHLCITVDDDFQHSPEGLLMLYNAIIARKDVDAVFARFPLKQHSHVRNLFTSLQRVVRNYEYKNARGIEFTSFRILRKEIVGAILKLNIGFPKIGLMSLMVGAKVVNVDVEHRKREHGKSSYSVSKLFRSFIKFMFYYTSIPAKLVKYLSVCVGILAIFSLWVLFYSPNLMFTMVLIAMTFSSFVAVFALSIACKRVKARSDKVNITNLLQVNEFVGLQIVRDER